MTIQCYLQIHNTVVDVDNNDDVDKDKDNDNDDDDIYMTM